MINSHWEGVILAGNVFIIYIKTIRILRIFRREGDIIQPVVALRGVYTPVHRAMEYSWDLRPSVL